MLVLVGGLARDLRVWLMTLVICRFSMAFDYLMPLLLKIPIIASTYFGAREIYPKLETDEAYWKLFDSKSTPNIPDDHFFRAREKK